MLRHASAVLAALLTCDFAQAQWSSFRPVTIDLLPKDQRELDKQTVQDGKVVPKEIRVDWYGFQLRGTTNIVEHRYQYPVADPTLAPGDKIIRVRATEVSDAETVTAALRAAPDGNGIPIIVERQNGDVMEATKITLYRAHSITLNELFNGGISVRPPVPASDKPGAWGEVLDLSFSVVAISDDGEGIFRGYIKVPTFSREGRSATTFRRVDVANAVLRGWNVAGLDVGESADFRPTQKAAENVTDNGAQQLALKSGSSGMPGGKTNGGHGFLSRRKNLSEDFIIGIAPNETVQVDGKPLKVNVLINMN
jgi:membrane-associated protease RseP (regulator of RpoE activity)